MCALATVTRQVRQLTEATIMSAWNKEQILLQAVSKSGKESQESPIMNKEPDYA
jgi:hypothetical protein